MIRFLLACLLVVCPNVVAASDVGPIDNNVGLPDEDIASGSCHLHAVNATELLFVNIEGIAAGELEFRFLLNGEPLLTERLQISDAVDNGDGPPAIGVLAAHPAELYQFYSMQSQNAGTLNVEFWSNGLYVMTRSFKELVTDSALLLKKPFQPQVAEGVVSGPAKVQRRFSNMKPPCEVTCEVEFEECMATFCPGQDTCEECETQYIYCMDDCEPPDPDPCPTSVVYYWTQWDLISSHIHMNVWCFEYPWFSGEGRWYDEVVFLVKRSYIKKTTINCITTTQIIRYEYKEVSCNRMSWMYCPFPTFPFNICY